MHIACKFGHERTVMELLRHRRVLDINALNKNEETPAVLAYKYGYPLVNAFPPTPRLLSIAAGA